MSGHLPGPGEPERPPCPQNGGGPAAERSVVVQGDNRGIVSTGDNAFNVIYAHGRFVEVDSVMELPFLTPPPLPASPAVRLFGRDALVDHVVECVTAGRSAQLYGQADIGKKAITVPNGVTANIGDGQISVKGPKGTLTMPMVDDIKYEMVDGGISVQPANDTKRARSFWGMQRTMVQNLVTGVTEGFTKTLEITGVGYRATAQGKTLKLQLGYSHDVNFAVPEGIEIKTPDQTTVEINGIDKQKVGQVAAEIRRWRKPEPYKGKGIKYRGEYIFRKEGKKK